MRTSSFDLLTPSEHTELQTWLKDTEFVPVSDQATYHAPMCRCGSRNTKAVGKTALERECQSCLRTFVYRLWNGYLIPLGKATAEAWDEERAR